MKKIASCILTLIILIFVDIVPVSLHAFAADTTDNVVIVMSGKVEGSEITVDANLRENTGISDLQAEIAYDSSAMTLTKIDQGWALESLEYVERGKEAETTAPYVLLWSGSGDKNDNSTGRLVRLHFSLNADAEDGEYEITLKQVKAAYLNEGTDVGTKKVLVGGVKVKIKGNKPEAVVTETAEVAVNTELLIAICASSVLVIAIVIFLLIKIKGKKS